MTVSKEPMMFPEPKSDPDLHEEKAFFPKTLYSNKELLKTRTFGVVALIFILLVNISLISAPFFMARFARTPDQVFKYLPGFEQAWKATALLELPCSIQNGTFGCDGPTVETYPVGDYLLYILPDQVQTDQLTGSSILFGSNRVYLFYDSEDDDLDYRLEGDYRLLEGLDLAIINPSALHMDNLSESEFYLQVAGTFLVSVHNSELGSAMSLIYLAQMVQTVLYALIMSLLLLTSNFHRSVKKITYATSWRYVIVGMTGPALLACLVGLINTLLGTILWSAVYAVRMILLYSRINKTEITL